MYVKNLAELKKALKTEQSLIQVKDEKFKAKIIKSAMKKGRLYNYEGQQINDLNQLKTIGAVASSTLIILSILALFAILGIYALYNKYNIKVIINKDGTLTFETSYSNATVVSPSVNT